MEGYTGGTQGGHIEGMLGGGRWEWERGIGEEGGEEESGEGGWGC